MERVEGFLLTIFLPNINILDILFFVVSIWIIRKLLWNVEERTFEQREKNPELNTKILTCTKEYFNNFQSQNTKTVCSICGLRILATITQRLEEKFIADG
tara:strand:- start:1160 stop:1459 length:300 start_codon:yes stop_codon:yes gene_type:complete